MNQADLLDRCMEKLGKTTDYGLADGLGIPTNRISDYRSGRVKFDEWAYFKIGDVLGESPAYLMALVLSENHKNPDKQLIFKNFLTRVGLWIILAVIPVSYIGTSDTAYAAGNGLETRADSTYTAIMRSKIKGEISFAGSAAA